ncbi:MAG: helix-turn-helix domain-containing protein [bacterium]|nr:helix-turn-helix domain-containing protein [bacterium]
MAGLRGSSAPVPREDSERIKLPRIRRKTSQPELAPMAEVHQKNISKYENDGVVPSALTLKTIADALKVTTDYLLGSQREDAIQDKVLLKYLREVDNMPDDMRQAIIKVLDACVRDAKTRQAYVYADR